MPEHEIPPEIIFEQKKEQALRELREAAHEFMFSESADMEKHKAEILKSSHNEERAQQLFRDWYQAGVVEIDRVIKLAESKDASRMELGLALMKATMLLEIERLDDFSDDAYDIYKIATQSKYEALAELMLRLSGTF